MNSPIYYIPEAKAQPNFHQNQPNYYQGQPQPNYYQNQPNYQQGQPNYQQSQSHYYQNQPTGQQNFSQQPNYQQSQYNIQPSQSIPQQYQQNKPIPQQTQPSTQQYQQNYPQQQNLYQNQPTYGQTQPNVQQNQQSTQQNQPTIPQGLSSFPLAESNYIQQPSSQQTIQQSQQSVQQYQSTVSQQPNPYQNQSTYPQTQPNVQQNQPNNTQQSQSNFQQENFNITLDSFAPTQNTNTNMAPSQMLPNTNMAPSQMLPNTNMAPSQMLPNTNMAPSQMLLSKQPNKFGISISITGENTYQEESIAYTIYNIQGYSQKGQFSTTKGYMDFVNVKFLLANKFPALKKYLEIPDKALFLKLDDSQNEARKRGLENFLMAVACSQELFYSTDFQTFLATTAYPAKQQIEYLRKHNPFIMYNNPALQQNVDINIVKEYEKTDGIILKHKEYVIQGSDEKGQFMVSRRYKDFVKIREILVAKFPGVPFLHLPSVTSQNTPERTQGLITFLRSIPKMPFAYQSIEWQLFVRCADSDFKKKLKPFHKSQSILKTILK
jgi:hypothetical protein